MNRFLPQTTAILVVSILINLSVGAALADVVSWTGDGDGASWSDPSNWDMALTPGIGDDVLITLDGTYTVTLDMDAAVLSLTLGAASGTQTLYVPSHTLDLDDVSSIGANGVLSLRSSTVDGPLANQGALLVAGTCAINSAPGEFTNESGATLRIEGNGSVGASWLTVANGFTNEGTIELGAVVSGYSAGLTVTNGTLVNTNLIDVQSGTGGARYIYAALDNQGTIDLARPTTINAAGAADHVNSGTINVAGGNLTFTLASDTFANSGELNIAEGRTLYLNGGTFSNFVAGILTGGTYNVLGTFKFTGADIVTNAATIVLDGPGSQIVNQSNADALANFAANDLAGDLTIINGRDLITAGAFANSGIVNITSECTLAVGGDYTQAAGSTVLDDGTLDTAGLVDIQGGALSGNGAIVGNLTNAGEVAPGMSPGQLNISGDYTQTADGLFSIEISGPTPGTEYDVLLVDGNAVLDGTLSVTLIEPYVPPADTEFDVLLASSVSGAFASDNLPLHYDQYCLGSEYHAASLTLITSLGAAIAQEPLSQAVCEGDAATFSVTASGNGPFDYQWRKDGVDIIGATSDSYTIDPVTPDDVGDYDVIVTNVCGSATSDVATLTINLAPTIATQPLSQEVCEDGAVTFSVEATETPAPTYQWRKDGVDISGATGDNYTIDPVTANDAGDYDVVVTNACGSATSDVATLAINLAPTITTQPVSQEVCEGGAVTLTAEADGQPEPEFQWYDDSGPIEGATEASLTLDPVTADDAGTYYVAAENLCGTAMSLTVTLTVNTGAEIVDEPDLLTVSVGEPAEFTVIAGGTEPLTYQWYKDDIAIEDGEHISGATTATLTIDPAELADAGEYHLEAGNACGTTSSTAAALTVLLAGDLNCDGAVDFDDIDPLVLALGGQASYEAAYPDCNWLNADTNGDGNVGFDDIDPFVALLGGG